MGGTYGLRRSFEQSGSIVKGHFEFASGRHATEKIQLERGLEKPGFYVEIGDTVGMAASEIEFDAYIGIPRGGDYVAGMVALHQPQKPRFRLRKTPTGFIWLSAKPRAPEDVGQNWLIVDDVLNHGTNIQKVAAILGPAVTCRYIAVVQRGPAESVQNIDGVALIDYPMTDYASDECPAAECQS